MRRFVILAPAVVALAAARFAGAQAVLSQTYRFAPQYVSYKIDAPVGRTISELAIPFAFVMPLGSRFTVDLATAYANARVEGNGGTFSSRVDGITDTQVRGNFTIGADAIVLTLGVNLPTGQATVDSAQRLAAGNIGNDFFAFPISNMGTGLAGTGGIAIARPLGSWNVGFGGSVRRSAKYEPGLEDDAGSQVKYLPGDEYRARLGVDRPIGAGRMALGMTYSAFGDDNAGSFTYSTGDRWVAQAAYNTPLRGTDLQLSAWNLRRLSGEQANGVTTPPENIANLAMSLAWRLGDASLEPNVELRHWSRDGERAGQLAMLGLRTRVSVGDVGAIPSVAYTTGSLTLPSSTGSGGESIPGADADLNGWRVALTMRYPR